MIGSYKKNRKRFGKRYSWQAHQIRTNRRSLKGRILRQVSIFCGIPIFLTLLFYQGTGGDSYPHGVAGKPGNRTYAAADNIRPIEKSDVQQMLNGVRLVNLEKKSLDVYYLGKPYHIDTSLDIALQQYLQRKLNRATSRYIGIVVMDPVDGRILSMIGYDKENSQRNPCLNNEYPAASIFKIITAAAAIETNGLEADSPLFYNGRKHTLYRSQLKDRKNRWTRKITLRDSFAQSINPVFGKIGARDLGKSVLEKYAAAFGFNRKIDFELPMTPSVVTISDEPYRWAEIASGFNRMTTLSPLHGALIAATVLNEGKLIEPTIIEKVIDGDGRTIYRGHAESLNQAITPGASEVVHQLMRATVQSGTSRKAFKGYRRDRVLSKLIIGGKTGSINNKTQDARFDWFVGFAEEKDGPKKLAVAAVVAHEKYIGIRAGRYARMAIRHYFRDYFSKQVATSKKTPKSS